MTFEGILYGLIAAWFSLAIPFSISLFTNRNDKPWGMKLEEFRPTFKKEKK